MNAHSFVKPQITKCKHKHEKLRKIIRKNPERYKVGTLSTTMTSSRSANLSLKQHQVSKDL